MSLYPSGGSNDGETLGEAEGLIEGETL